MKAIDKLLKSGLTYQQIAAALGVTPHAVRFWARGLRSPKHDSRKKLLALAESKGLLLLGSDFSMDSDTND